MNDWESPSSSVNVLKEYTCEKVLKLDKKIKRRIIFKPAVDSINLEEKKRFKLLFLVFGIIKYVLKYYWDLLTFITYLYFGTPPMGTV